MVDESRRGRLLAMKLAALATHHGASDVLESAPFALGATAIDGPVGWVFLDERQQRGRSGIDLVQGEWLWHDL